MRVVEHEVSLPSAEGFYALEIKTFCIHTYSIFKHCRQYFEKSHFPNCKSCILTAVKNLFLSVSDCVKFCQRVKCIPSDDFVIKKFRTWQEKDVKKCQKI